MRFQRVREEKCSAAQIKRKKTIETKQNISFFFKSMAGRRLRA